MTALPENKVAFILDGKVVDVFHTDDRLASILLSNPTIVNATEYYKDKDPHFNIIDWTYDGNTITEVVNVIPIIDGTVPENPLVATISDATVVDPTV